MLLVLSTVATTSAGNNEKLIGTLDYGFVRVSYYDLENNTLRTVVETEKGDVAELIAPKVVNKLEPFNITVRVLKFNSAKCVDVDFMFGFFVSPPHTKSEYAIEYLSGFLEIEDTQPVVYQVPLDKYDYLRNTPLTVVYTCISFFLVPSEEVYSYVETYRESIGYHVLVPLVSISAVNMSLIDYLFYGRLYEGLLANYTVLEEAYKTLSENYTALLSEYRDLVVKYNQLRYNYTSLREEHSSLLKSYRDLEARFQNATQENSRLKDEVSKLMSTVDDLRNENAELMDKIEELKAINYICIGIAFLTIILALATRGGGRRK